MSQDYEDDRDEGAADEGLPPEEPAVRAAANRTNAPGIFLILCGVLNLVGVAVWGFGCFKFAQQTVDEYEMQVEQGSQASPLAKSFYDAQIEAVMKERLNKDPKDLPPDQLKEARHEAMKEIVNEQHKSVLWQGPLFGALGLLAAVLPILGGARMRSLRSYGLSVTGAIVAAIPCLSIASCPCFLGLIFGIWALVVLLNPDVKNAFS
jgi:hypothetical protein